MGLLSNGKSSSLNLHEFIILGNSVSANLLVVETSLTWTNAILFTHLEVLAEGLITAPPIEVDHADALIALRLVEVRVTHVVFDSVRGEASIGSQLAVALVHLTDSPSKVFHHALFLVLGKDPAKEGGVEMEGDQGVHKSESVLVVERLHFPVDVAEGVFEEASDVLECSPFLCFVTRLRHFVHKFAKIAVSCLSKGTLS